MSTDRPGGETGIVHRHNLVGDAAQSESRFGLRMRLPPGDTFGDVLGEDWEKTRWFHTESGREAAMRELRRQHPYNRLGDRPTLILEKINRPGAGD